MLDGDSRPIVAGAIAPSEATGAAWLVLATAWLRYGAPEPLRSARGGAFPCDVFEAVGQRWAMQQEPRVSTQGDSSKNLMAPPFNIQRRWLASQGSLPPTPAE
jgi:hypothetical protein